MMKIPAKQTLMLVAAFGLASVHGGLMPDNPHTAPEPKEKDRAWYEENFPNMQQGEVAAAIEADAAVLVDANGKETYEKGHLPGAVHLEAVKEDPEAALPEDKDALIVAYCGGPNCRLWTKAADELHELGYTNVRHYRGGLEEWKESGRRLEASSGG